MSLKKIDLNIYNSLNTIQQLFPGALLTGARVCLSVLIFPESPQRCIIFIVSSLCFYQNYFNKYCNGVQPMLQLYVLLLCALLLHFILFETVDNRINYYSSYPMPNYNGFLAIVFVLNFLEFSNSQTLAMLELGK